MTSLSTMGGARFQRWAEYFKCFLDADEPEETLDFSVNTVSEELDIDMEAPSKEELDKAMNLLKRNKSPGTDNITSEILKDGGEAVREWLLRICQLMWQTEATPAEWGKGIILPLPQKGDLSYCNDNRTLNYKDLKINPKDCG